MQKHWITFILLLTGCGLALQVQAVPRNLLLNQEICAPKKIICLRGSFYFDERDQQMSFSGRVNKSTEPGKLILKIVGESDSGKNYKIKLKQTIKGSYSEIVTIKAPLSPKSVIPQDIKWKIEDVSYKLSKE